MRNEQGFVKKWGFVINTKEVRRQSDLVWLEISFAAEMFDECIKVSTVKSGFGRPLSEIQLQFLRRSDP